MDRIALINTLENYFPPLVNQAIKEELIGSTKKSTTLVAQTTLTLDFNKFSYQEITLGTQNITFNATVTGLKPGEKVFLKVTQNGSAARTITWGTNIVSNVIITAAVDAVDWLVGIFDGTNIVIGVILQDLNSVYTKSANTTVLTNETTLGITFANNEFYDITLGSDNITFNATVTGLQVNDRVLIKITQDSSAARTITWGTNIITDVTVTASTDAVDLLEGVFDGTNLIIAALAQNVS